MISDSKVVSVDAWVLESSRDYLQIGSWTLTVMVVFDGRNRMYRCIDASLHFKVIQENEFK